MLGLECQNPNLSSPDFFTQLLLLLTSSQQSQRVSLPLQLNTSFVSEPDMLQSRSNTMGLHGCRRQRRKEELCLVGTHYQTAPTVVIAFAAQPCDSALKLAKWPHMGLFRCWEGHRWRCFHIFIGHKLQTPRDLPQDLRLVFWLASGPRLRKDSLIANLPLQPLYALAMHETVLPNSIWDLMQISRIVPKYALSCLGSVANKSVSFLLLY